MVIRAKLMKLLYHLTRQLKLKRERFYVGLGLPKLLWEF
jgi:hypothetical protein